MTKKLILFLLLVWLVSCDSVKKVMNSWIGHTRQELIMGWGPPSRTASDGGDGEILVYAKQIYQAPSNSTFYSDNGTASTTYNQGNNYWKYSMFFVNSSGKIYHWLIQNQQIPPTQIDLTIYHGY